MSFGVFAPPHATFPNPELLILKHEFVLGGFFLFSAPPGRPFPILRKLFHSGTLNNSGAPSGAIYWIGFSNRIRIGIGLDYGNILLTSAIK